jgi:hypothetical protein
MPVSEAFDAHELARIEELKATSGIVRQDVGVIRK